MQACRERRRRAGSRPGRRSWPSASASPASAAWCRSPAAARLEALEFEDWSSRSPSRGSCSRSRGGAGGRAPRSTGRGARLRFRQRRERVVRRARDAAWARRSSSRIAPVSGSRTSLTLTGMPAAGAGGRHARRGGRRGAGARRVRRRRSRRAARRRPARAAASAAGRAGRPSASRGSSLIALAPPATTAAGGALELAGARRSWRVLAAARPASRRLRRRSGPGSRAARRRSP